MQSKKIKFTEKQLEIFGLYFSGLRNKQIAEYLGVTQSYISKVITGITEKINFTRRFTENIHWKRFYSAEKLKLVKTDPK